MELVYEALVWQDDSGYALMDECALRLWHQNVYFFHCDQAKAFVLDMPLCLTAQGCSKIKLCILRFLMEKEEAFARCTQDTNVLTRGDWLLLGLFAVRQYVALFVRHIAPRLTRLRSAEVHTLLLNSAKTSPAEVMRALLIHCPYLPHMVHYLRHYPLGQAGAKYDELRALCGELAMRELVIRRLLRSRHIPPELFLAMGASVPLERGPSSIKESQQ